MIALGIDLGLSGAAGLAVVEDGGLLRPQVLATLAQPPRQPAMWFLADISMLLGDWNPDLVVCERPWTGRRDPRPSVGLGMVA